MDETRLQEGHGVNGLVIGKSTLKSIMLKTPDSRIWTTVVECVSADGRYLPPLVIYKGKNLQQQWFPDEIGDDHGSWEFCATPNGWTSNDVAVE